MLNKNSFNFNPDEKEELDWQSLRSGSDCSLILYGFKSSGKTYFGKLLSQKLGINFIDTDDLIEGLYKLKYQEELDCRQISIILGVAAFRDFERSVINSLNLATPSIISVGGGAVINPENCLKLRNCGMLIYLQAAKETIKQRIYRDGIPSFLDLNDPEKSFDNIYEERKAIYSKISTFQVCVDEKSDEEVLDELISLWMGVCGKG